MGTINSGGLQGLQPMVNRFWDARNFTWSSSEEPHKGLGQWWWFAAHQQTSAESGKQSFEDIRTSICHGLDWWYRRFFPVPCTAALNGFHWSWAMLVKWQMRPLGLLMFQEELSLETRVPLPSLSLLVWCGCGDGARLARSSYCNDLLAVLHFTVLTHSMRLGGVISDKGLSFFFSSFPY